MDHAMRLLFLLVMLMPAPLCLVTACRAETVQLPGPDGVTLKAALFPAQGQPAGPAIVALHGCSGPFPHRDYDWARRLAAQGHTVLLPDSFGSRGLTSQCGLPMRDRAVTATGVRRQDAIAALQWLAAQPGTPPGGLVLMGWSDGASTVLTTGGGADLPSGLVRGMVAFYPACRPALAMPAWQPAAPLLIMIGEADDWTAAAPCHTLAEHHTEITLVSYAGAYHDFDVADRPVKLRAGTANTASGDAHTGSDPAARADVLQRVPAFIAALPPLTSPPATPMIQAPTPHEAAP